MLRRQRPLHAVGPLDQADAVAAEILLDAQLGDPDLTLCAEFTRRDEEGRFMGTWLVAYELCDSCDADNFGYKIDRVLVSDFVTPQFFETFWKEGQAQFDFRNHIKRPLQILEDGYLSVKHESGSRGWQEIGPPKQPCRYTGRPRVGSRRERRRIPRDQWLKSQPHPRRRAR